jgi:two-component system, NtrC family, sensor kinase
MTATTTKATLLIVDDEPSNLEVLGQILADHYRIKVARSGQKALLIAESTPCPDLILLDIMMPDLDGYAVLAALRNAPATREIPVIFVTALSSSSEETHGLSLGAADYITKPISPSVVLARVATQLELKAARDLLARQNQQLESEISRRTQELAKTQAQLIHAEKMASIGVLASGVAHEINNPIAYVSSNLGMLERHTQSLLNLINDTHGTIATQLDADHPLHPILAALREEYALSELKAELGELISESRNGIRRVVQIVKDLKYFSHSGTDQDAWQRVDIHQSIESSVNIIWNEIKYRTELIRDYAPLPPIECLPSQLSQVFLNLLVNANQAIAEHGTITLQSRVVQDSVVVKVSDNGKGIAAEHLARIFDPFFTTKPVGQGSGLGLSIAWNIVERHHGKLEVESTPAVGTTFILSLPINQPHQQVASP